MLPQPASNYCIEGSRRRPAISGELHIIAFAIDEVSGVTTISLALIQRAHIPRLVALTSLASPKLWTRQLNVHAIGAPIPRQT